MAEESKCWGDQTKKWKEYQLNMLLKTIDKTQNTNFCRLLHGSKFSRSLGGAGRPKISGRGTKTNFKDWGAASISDGIFNLPTQASPSTSQRGPAVPRTLPVRHRAPRLPACRPPVHASTITTTYYNLSTSRACKTSCLVPRQQQTIRHQTKSLLQTPRTRHLASSASSLPTPPWSSNFEPGDLCFIICALCPLRNATISTSSGGGRRVVQMWRGVVRAGASRQSSCTIFRCSFLPSSWVRVDLAYFLIMLL